MVDGLLAIHPKRKYHEIALRSPSQRSRMKKRMEEEVISLIAEDMYELDTYCRRRLGRRCKRLCNSPEFIYVGLMIQDRIRPMTIVHYLRRCDPQHFARNMITDDALRMSVARMTRIICS